MESKNRRLFVCGDLHGNVKSFIYDKIKRYKITGADIVVAGDFGVGFGKPNSMNVTYDGVKEALGEDDNTLYVVRGNHDDPEYFDGNHDYDRIKFVPDYKVIVLGNGMSVLPVGGATSVDLDSPSGAKGKSRRMINNELIRRGSSERVWWEDEKVREAYDELPIRVDIIVSHEAPISFPPVPIRPSVSAFAIDDETWEQIEKERKYLQYIADKVVSNWWLYGHYHDSFSGCFGNKKFRGLDIEEVFEIYTSKEEEEEEEQADD